MRFADADYEHSRQIYTYLNFSHKKLSIGPICFWQYTYLVVLETLYIYYLFNFVGKHLTFVEPMHSCPLKLGYRKALSMYRCRRKSCLGPIYNQKVKTTKHFKKVRRHGFRAYQPDLGCKIEVICVFIIMFNLDTFVHIFLTYSTLYDKLYAYLENTLR